MGCRFTPEVSPKKQRALALALRPVLHVQAQPHARHPPRSLQLSHRTQHQQPAPREQAKSCACRAQREDATGHLHSGSTAERTGNAVQPRSANSFRLWDSTYIGRLCDRMNTAPSDRTRFPTNCYLQWESWDRQKALDWPAKFGSKAAPAFADTVNHIAEPTAPRTHPGKDTHVQHFYLLALAPP